MGTNLTSLSISELQQGLLGKKFSSVEVVAEYLANIKKYDASLHAFLQVNEESALAKAKQLDNKISQGESLGALAGVPMGVKDVIVTKNLATTAGSKILVDFKPPYSATIVEKIESAGAIVLGKTNCDEFAMGTSGENSGFGPTLNPWDKSCVPGGSSSGSAAAVAAQECLVSLGTDTGGSVRQPAAFCGVVGFKPTYGRVSRYGLVAMTSSLDQAGPLARSVADAALVLKNIAGHDSHDATSSQQPVPDYVQDLNKPIRGLKIGVPKEFFSEGLDKNVKEVVQKAIEKVGQLGAEIQEVSLPTMPYALAAYYVICPAEVSTNLARYDGIKFGKRLKGDTLYEVYTKTRGSLLGAEAKRRIMLGTYVLSAGYYEAFYVKAQAARASIKADFDQVFSKVDALIAPTTPTVAFKLGSKTQDPLAMYLADMYTVPANIAGLPAISIPAGLVDGLPVGVQFIGQSFNESTLLRLAYNFEQATEWHKLQPNSKI